MINRPEPPPRFIATIRRIYRKARADARAEIIKHLGQAWRGGRVDAAYLSGRIPFLVLPTQHDTVTISIGLNSDTGTQAITFPDAYPSTTLASGASGGTNSLHVASLASLAGFTLGQTITVTQVSGGTASEKLIISGIDTTLFVLTTTTALTNAYSTGDTVQVIPDITPGSSDVGWVASYANVTPTGFDLSLARRVLLENPEFGTVADTIPSGSDHKDVSVTFPTAYQATPVVVPNINNDLCRVTLISSLTGTAVASFRVSYVPTTAAGTIGKSPTGIMPSAGAERTDAVTGVTAGSPSPNATNSVTGVTTSNTNNVTPNGTTSSETGTAITAAGAAANHAHVENTAATYTQSANTQAAGQNHQHNMDHTHHVPDHSHDLGNHGHSIPDHSHNLTEPNSGAGHDHAFTGSAQNAPTNIPFTIHWVAYGTRAAPAVSKDASWVAQGT